MSAATCSTVALPTAAPLTHATGHAPPQPDGTRPPHTSWRRLAVGTLACAAALTLAGCEHGAAPGRPGAAEPPGTCGLPDFQAQALAKLNDYRAAQARCGVQGRFGAAAPVTWQPVLAAVATAHSRDMARRNSLNHGSSDGRTLTQRLDAAGYAWSAAAENIAAGQPQLAQVLSDWVRSPAHCANQMAPTYTEAGLACQRAADGTPYWTLVLAKPR